ncbi:TPA: molecular chaperone [Klebsiella quasipneumoniae subsp. quasipneumoniae]|nr:molecular chaperone [Klebsiella quasipneumoniae subsp. similipneumoniae]HBR1458095.1 molecular chaperone [Klebsiella quasipneumoniae subsp. quasipneumoniae]HBR1982846.1 molecular chaperone [Klebsiella quasipneumoniae subsp. quasipneumoniae]HBR2036005.1 molecular chaperone [Klebsiella quasipneumoniae subsp. quasipneumoniae]HCI6432703.1 molecular chaperone [Klebsiella quasipneumoniae subsp. similipneumoniae]
MNRYADVVLALVLAFLSVQAQAGIVIGGTRVVYDGDKKEASAAIRNPEKSGVYLVQSWVDSGGQGGKAPFIVTPPLFRINPDEENILRIVRTGGSLPQDRESVFWLNVKSIPATDDSQPRTNVLQVVVKSRIKLFYRPAGLEGQPESAYHLLSVARSGNRLTVSNPTPYYVTLFTLKADGQEIKEADMVPPKGSVSFTLPSANITHVTWQAISDYGGVSQTESRRL